MTTKRPFRKYQKVDLRVQDMAFEGKGIAKIETDGGKYVVFIPNTIPGQLVNIKITKPKSSFAEAKLLKVVEKSTEEVETSFFPIPGAPYITLPVERQHFYKRNTTIQLFRRIGKVEDAEKKLDEFISSPDNFHYRNKMEYSFSAVVFDPQTGKEYDGFALGFKNRGQWLSVIPLQGDSGMFDADLENVLPKISEFFIKRGHSAWHARRHEGFCRFLTVRKSFYQNKLLMNLTTSSSENFNQKAFASFMKNLLGEKLGGLVHTINNDPGDRPVTSEGRQHLLFGEPGLIEEIHGLKFRISLESFFQTNPASAGKLYHKALDYVYEDLSEDMPVILDLFSGTGTIAQLLATQSKGQKVVGVELVPEAVEDARKNAEMNGIENITFHAADVGKFLKEHPDYRGKIHTLVMDPPRAGIAPKTLQKVIALGAPRVVYISCNPATQARDMTILHEAGYELKKYSLVDQFPHTAHIESVGLFEKRV